MPNTNVGKIDYRKRFFPEHKYEFLISEQQAMFRVIQTEDVKIVYPSNLDDGELWDVEQTKVLIELLQESLQFVEQKDVEHHNERLSEWKENRYKNRVQKPKDHSGFVYVMQSANGFYKVGFSKNPERRLKEIQKNTPFKVWFLHMIETKNMVTLEKHFHEVFKVNRSKGEWFMLSKGQIDYFMNYTEG